MRLGYACISTMVRDCSPAKTVTVKRLESISDPATRLELCRNVARTNLLNTRRLVFHTAAHGLSLYRITPQLVPLATHPVMAAWDWTGELAAEFAAAGEAMRELGLRVSSHPGMYTVLNSPKETVVSSAAADLEYHARLHQLLNHGSDGRIVIHVGGAQGGKAEALARFARNFGRLSPAVRRRLAVENDDTVFGTADVLPLCQRLGVPMVLDLHHHMIHPGGVELRDVLCAVFATWPPDVAPKIHVSSPRGLDEPKAHADYIDSQQFEEFRSLAAEVKARPFDVMVEAKMKDAAALQLASDLGLKLCPRFIAH